MKPITMEDLKNSITQAQYTVCVQHLRDLKCPMCQQPKEYYRCFCRTCYFALPEQYRGPLYIERRTPPDLEIFVTGYLAAKDFLRSIGRGEPVAA
jgi:hypothetical protein